MKKYIFSVLLMLLGIASTAMAQLPSVTLKDINGKTVRTDTLNNGGKPFIIDFFATWCHPCNRELKAINEVYEDWQKETGVKLDPNSDFKRALGIQMIPYVIVCDGKGNIVYKHNGYTDGAENELLAKVKELLK